MWCFRWGCGPGWHLFQWLQLSVVDRERSEINACCREATGGNSAVKGSIPRDYFKWSCLTWGNKYCSILVLIPIFISMCSQTHNTFQLECTVSIVVHLSPILLARISLYKANIGINIILVAQDLEYQATIVALQFPRDMLVCFHFTLTLLLQVTPDTWCQCRLND